MIASVRVLDNVTRRTPLGLSLCDVSGAREPLDGLEIVVRLKTRPRISTRAFVNRSGIYCAADLPGLAQFERSPDDIEAWNIPPRPYRVEIRDPQHRFLRIVFDAELPFHGLFDDIWPSLSPPSFFARGVPLFSTPSRPSPEPFAVVRAQLRELRTERAAA